MFSANKISLIIPVLNEEKNINQVLSFVPKIVDEVIVVDNGSVDSTIDICKRFDVRVICEKIKGYGSALKTGIQAANGDIIICLDGDATYPLSEIEAFLNLIVNRNYDFVSGERIFAWDAKNMHILNWLGNRQISWIIRSCFGIKLKDIMSGMWVFKRKIIPKIMPTSLGMEFTLEIKLRAWLTPGIFCNELRMSYHKRLTGKSKFRRVRDSLRVFNSFLKFAVKFHGLKQHELADQKQVAS